MKKESLSALLFATFVLPLSACGGNPASNSSGSAGSASSTQPTTSSGAPSSSTKIEGPSVAFHYYRDDGAYDTWSLWLWPVGADGRQYFKTGTDSYGGVYQYALSTWVSDPATYKDFTLNFIVRDSSWNKDPDGDRKVTMSDLPYDETSQTYSLWLKTADATIYTSEPSKLALSVCRFDSAVKGHARANQPVASYSVEADGASVASGTISPAAKTFYFNLTSEANIRKLYTLTATFESGDKISKEIDISALYNLDSFTNDYTYYGHDLGANYASVSTTFKVWSPVSQSVTLRIYESGTPVALNATKGDDTHHDYPMTFGEKGVWSVVVDGDLAGKYYTLIVSNSHFDQTEIVDPYAKSCGVNGLRGMIVDFSKTNPTGWDDFSVAHPYDRKQETVYETHVADVTSSSTWGGSAANSKKFLGLAETGTKYTSGSTSVTTGFDHIKELGVNAVQLLPIFDQANDEVNASFNWGYNPLNYNALDGIYSSDPYDGYARIKEFKSVVKAYYDAGINIIMDVVYNHVNGASGSNFDVLVPYYYFRYDTSLSLYNGSGCGNETASNHIMFRNFMIDSTAFWLKEYKLGGFRFDLMGLHDLETMNLLTANCQTINPKVTIYGEPWTGGTSGLLSTLAATQANGNSYVGYGQFNDGMRDSLIKGGLNSVSALGWVDTQNAPSAGDLSKIVAGVKGFTHSGSNQIDDPDKTTNYTTCHDNYTLTDRFAATGRTYTADQLEAMNVLANAVVFTSQGTTFMLAGEEFLRSKGGNGNSYNASYAVNELDYALKAAHPRMFRNYQKLIALKQNLDGLHLDKSGAASLTPSFNADGNELNFTLTDTANKRVYQVVHADGYGTAPSVNLSGYTLAIDTLESDVALSAATPLLPYQTLIAYKAA